MNDLQAIQDCVLTYVEGQYEANREKLERAFHKSFHLIGSTINTMEPEENAPLVITSRQEFIDLIMTRKSPLALGLPISRKFIEFSLTSPTTAVAVILVDLYEGKTWQDTLTLMKEKGEWYLTHKAYYRVFK